MRIFFSYLKAIELKIDVNNKLVIKLAVNK